jgi:protein-disulfide isomerase
LDKRFLVVLSIIILALGGLFIYTRSQNDDSNNNAGVSNHVRDNSASGVTLTVYGDFQCSVCKPFYYLEKQVLEQYPGQIVMTFRHFPLDSIHPNARAASRAAEAAGLQDKFFEMHDMLYENQDSWSSASQTQSIFESYAAALGLDVTQFRADFASATVNDTINADKAEGERLGVDGTPTFFLNGEKLNNSDVSTAETFSAKIEAALSANNN